MNKAALLSIVTVIAAVAVLITTGVYASEPQVEKEQTAMEKPNTIFQKLGEIITGECDMGGKPLKKTGIFQPMADGIKELASGRSRETGPAAPEPASGN